MSTLWAEELKDFMPDQEDDKYRRKAKLNTIIFTQIAAHAESDDIVAKIRDYIKAAYEVDISADEIWEGIGYFNNIVDDICCNNSYDLSGGLE